MQRQVLQKPINIKTAWLTATCEAKGQVVARLRGKQDNSNRNSDPGALSAADAAEYVSGLLPEMILVADRAGLDLVAYLLRMANDAATEEMARAKQAAGRSRSSSSDRSR